MQWSLFLLTLMGQCSFFTCRLYEYHFIEESKTWTEAQAYCRDHYTDLATVLDETDVERLHNTGQNHDGAWIGLHSINEKNIDKWQWSLPGVEFNNDSNQWRQGEPNDYRNNRENCVWMENNQWIDVRCDWKSKFICYDEKEDKKFHLINQSKTWLEAQSHCREHHTDLVSGHEQLNDGEFKQVINSNQMKRDKLWIGLTRDIWRWSDGNSSSFRNWDLSFNYKINKKCATTDSNGKWKSEECVQEKHFFCYADQSQSSTTSEAPSTSTPTQSTTPASTDQSQSSTTSEAPSTSTPTQSTTPARTEETDCSMTDKMFLIKKNMSWPDALYYCRDHYTDLVFITNSHQQRCVQKIASEADSPYVWNGLRYTCTLDFWFWVSDEVVIYKNWDSPDQTDECDMSGAMDRGGEHKWFKKIDHNEFNFICFK